MSTNIAVYADWVGLAEPTRLGWLYARRGAGREVFEFAFEPSALANSGFRGIWIRGWGISKGASTHRKGKRFLVFSPIRAPIVGGGC